MYGHDPTSNRSVAEKDALEIISLIGLTDKQHLKPNALAVIERKKLEPALALATRPRLPLLDEVKAGLTDPKTRP